MKLRWKFWQMAGLTCLLNGSLVAGELTGVLAWGERMDMGSLVSGMVSEVPVRAGQRVSRGDLLLGLDRRGFRADLDGAIAEAAHAQARLEEAQREDERATELYDRTLLSEHERALAITVLREAEAVAARASANLEKARLAHERSQLTAPFDGVVIAVHAAPGQAVLSDHQVAALVELAGDTHMRVSSRADMATAREAIDAQLMVEVAGRQLKAERVEVGFEPVDQAQGRPRYAFRAYFVRPADLELRAGESARLYW